MLRPGEAAAFLRVEEDVVIQAAERGEVPRGRQGASGASRGMRCSVGWPAWGRARTSGGAGAVAPGRNSVKAHPSRPRSAALAVADTRGRDTEDLLEKAKPHGRFRSLTDLDQLETEVEAAVADEIARALDGGPSLSRTERVDSLGRESLARCIQKWQAAGVGLEDRSSCPHRQPRRLSHAEDEPILRARRQTNLGPGPLAGIAPQALSLCDLVGLLRAAARRQGGPFPAQGGPLRRRSTQCLLSASPRMPLPDTGLPAGSEKNLVEGGRYRHRSAIDLWRGEVCCVVSEMSGWSFWYPSRP